MFSRLRRRPAHTPTLTGNCPVRQHTGDGAYVGRCDYACYDEICPKHGRLSDYPHGDDRDVAVADRDLGELAGFFAAKR